MPRAPCIQVNASSCSQSAYFLIAHILFIEMLFGLKLVVEKNLAQRKSSIYVSYPVTSSFLE